MEDIFWITLCFLLFQGIVSKTMWHACNGKEYDELPPTYEEPPSYEDIV